MAVVIRLARTGTTNLPRYRVTIADSRKFRDGKFLAQVGWYDPTAKKDGIKLDLPVIDSWIAKGAQPSESVGHLIKRYRVANPQ